MLMSGWAFFGANQAFPCPGAGDFEACPALLLNSNTTMDSSTCAVGYEGPVCGNCQDSYNHLKVGNECDGCDDNVVNVPLIVGLLFGGLVVGGAVVSGAMGVLSDYGEYPTESHPRVRPSCCHVCFPVRMADSNVVWVSQVSSRISES